LPSSPDYKRRWAEPVFYEIEPLSLEEVTKQMDYIEGSIYLYTKHEVLPKPLKGEYSWKVNKKNKNWEHWYKPHYTSMYCPWKDQEVDLCGCSTEKAYIVETSDIDPAELCGTIKENEEEK
jgi:hypothetical protein